MNPTYIVENTFRPAQFASASLAVGTAGAVAASTGPFLMPFENVLPMLYP